MRMSLKLNNKPRLVTSQRELILCVIKEAGTHLDAKQIFRKANERDPGISLATVYRSLKLFSEVGLIEERCLGQELCYYEIRKKPDHQHLICRSCGKIIEFQDPSISRLIRSIQRKQGFSVIKADLYLEGYCRGCEKNSKMRTTAVLG
jgi:Fur family ferric uptake transcriptional regulator